jgi:hypothetical protein
MEHITTSIKFYYVGGTLAGTFAGMIGLCFFYYKVELGKSILVPIIIP